MLIIGWVLARRAGRAYARPAKDPGGTETVVDAATLQPKGTVALGGEVGNARRPGFRGIVLRYGLQVAVEAKVLADVNGTSGIQSQTYASADHAA